MSVGVMAAREHLCRFSPQNATFLHCILGTAGDQDHDMCCCGKRGCSKDDGSTYTVASDEQGYEAGTLVGVANLAVLGHARAHRDHSLL